MYTTHQPVIMKHALQSPDNMLETLCFVLLTIQQSLFTVPDMMRDVRRNGTSSKNLWGFKEPAYEWLSENKKTVFERAWLTSYGFSDPLVREQELLLMFASLPGMGLVKGGFACQLLFGVGGCIDTHNQQIYNVSPDRFKASRFKVGSPRLRSQMTSEYSQLCTELGGSQVLWDRWCGHVAERNHVTAHRVSEIHVEAIMGR